MVRTASNLSTGEKLLSIIDDIELVAKEMIENAIALKHQKLQGIEQIHLTELLVLKDHELRDTLKIASEQARIEHKMDIVQAEVDKLDQDIQLLQKQLKEAEQIMATAIYQAKEKLASIQRANKHPVSSEDLIKFAHRISASNAVCAPLTWQPGDPRRPYPTDIEMRLGHLGRMSDAGAPLNGGSQHMMAGGPMQPDPSSLQHHRPPMHGNEGVNVVPAAASNQFAWHPSGEMHVAVGGGGSVPMDTRTNVADDVEVMSSDSSSSSSSDSQ